MHRYLSQNSVFLRIVKNISWLLIEKIVRLGVGLSVGIWIARHLGPEQFGLLSFATVFVTLFGSFATLGVRSVVVKDLVSDTELRDETLAATGILLMVSGVLFYSLMVLSIKLLRPGDAEALVLVAIMGSATILKVGELSIYWFESQTLSKYVVWVQTLILILFGLIKVLLILKGASLTFFALAFTAEAALASICLLVTFSKLGPKLRLVQFSFKRARKLLSDSWPLLLSGIAISIYLRVDQIMLKQMSGDTAVGVYSAATRISEAVYFLPVIIVASVFPALVEMRKNSLERYYDNLQRTYDTVLWLAIFLIIPITIFSSEIVQLLYGKAFAAAGSVLALHAWASIFVFLGVASSKWFVLENKLMLNFYRTLAGAFINIGLNFLLIPSLGPEGAAISTILAYFIVTIVADLFYVDTRKLFWMKFKAFNLFSAINRFGKY